MKKPHHIAEPGCTKEENNGRYQIHPRGLNIVWGDDPRYWSIDTSKKDGFATLIQVSWLDVSGVVKVDTGRSYTVRFEVKLKPDAFGWAGSPVLVMAKVGKKGKYKYYEMTLSNSEEDSVMIPPENSASQVEVYVPPNAEEPKIYFGLYEVWSGKWKGGLQIKNVYVDPITRGSR